MKSDRVLLIKPFPSFAREINEATNYPPLGLMYIASFLESKGVECRIVDAGLLKLNSQSILRIVADFNPSLVGITSNIAFARDTNLLSKFLKERTGKFIAIGGPFASSMAEKTLEESGADCVVRGEGELIMWNILRHGLQLKDVKGVSFLKDGKLVNNEREELISELDKLPFPAYHLLPDLGLYKSRSRAHPVGIILTSRGCPYHCIYCSKSVFGDKFRKRSPENIIKEIDFLVKGYKVKQIDILDDNFTLDIGWAEQVLDMLIKRGYGLYITFPNGLRADRLSRRIVHKMKLAGVYKVGIGIETGDKEVMKLIKKNLDLEKVIESIRWFREEKITVFGFFMLGLPGETKAAMQRTIDFAIRSNPHIANFAITIPMPDTELYEIIKSKGRFIERDKPNIKSSLKFKSDTIKSEIKSDTIKSDTIKSDIKLDVEPGISKGYYTIGKGYYELGELKSRDVRKYQKKAYTSFYFRPSKIFEFLLLIRSWRELRWTITTAIPLVKGIFRSR